MFARFKRFKIVILVNKAYQAAAYTRYEEALDCLQAAETLGLSKYYKPWTKMSAQAYLLKASVLIHLNRYEEALRMLVVLQEFFLSQQNQTTELKYLECFAGVLAREPLRSQELKYSKLAMRGFEVFKTPYDAVNLSAVPTHLKRKFPLRSHPAWAERF